MIPDEDGLIPIQGPAQLLRTPQSLARKTRPCRERAGTRRGQSRPLAPLLTEVNKQTSMLLLTDQQALCSHPGSPCGEDRQAPPDCCMIGHAPLIRSPTISMPHATWPFPALVGKATNRPLRTHAAASFDEPILDRRFLPFLDSHQPTDTRPDALPQVGGTAPQVKK